MLGQKQAIGIRRAGSLSVAVAMSAALATACGFVRQAQIPQAPQTLGERNSGYTYVPLDPLPVISRPDGNRGCGPNAQVSDYEPIPRAFPDNAVRIAVASFTASGDLSFGPLQLGTSGNTYQVVLDYINADISNIYFDIGYTVADDPVPRSLSALDALPSGAKIRVKRYEPDADYVPMGDSIIIPVYLGLGLRLTATITVLQGSVNLTSLGAIAAAAEAERATGSLVVQTLGLTGSQITATLPLPSELDRTNIQNAILSLGAIKALLYEEQAIKTPRVTGIYNPLGIGNSRFINLIVSELAREPIVWKRVCKNFENRVTNPQG